MLPLTVLSLFELRKPLFLSGQEKKVNARLFKHRDHFGIYDATGVIWPIFFQEKEWENSLEIGGHVSLRVKADYSGSEQDLKYKDKDLSIRITGIESKTPCMDTSTDADFCAIGRCLSDGLSMPPLGSQFWSPPSFSKTTLLKKRQFSYHRMRRFFRTHGFLEMDTPTLVPLGGVERYLSPFQTSYEDHRGGRHTFDLPTSPELALKKLLTEGYSKIFQFARCYRNRGELSAWHEPEFFMLEWYEVGGRLEHLMELTQNLILSLAESLGLRGPAATTPWPRVSVTELLKEHAGFSLEEVQELGQFRTKALRISPSCCPTDDWDTLFCKVFMDCVEPWLKTQAFCFVYDFPAQMPGLAKVEGVISKRVELYANGVELSNGFEELTDWRLYAERWRASSQAPPDAAFPDPVFLKKMQFGLPQCCGNALGVDRLIAVLLGQADIQSLMPIPFLSQFVKGQVAAE